MWDTQVLAWEADLSWDLCGWDVAPLVEGKLGPSLSAASVGMVVQACSPGISVGSRFKNSGGSMGSLRTLSYNPGCPHISQAPVQVAGGSPCQEAREASKLSLLEASRVIC